MSECIHELPIESCSYCKPEKPPVLWDARYDGTCTFAGCANSQIVVGQRLKWNKAGTSAIHSGHRE